MSHSAGIQVMTSPTADRWLEWQAAVVVLLQGELEEILPDIQADDVDWTSWQPLFDEGWSPRAAVERTFAAAQGLPLREFLLSPVRR